MELDTLNKPLCKVKIHIHTQNNILKYKCISKKHIKIDAKKRKEVEFGLNMKNRGNVKKFKREIFHEEIYSSPPLSTGNTFQDPLDT